MLGNRKFDIDDPNKGSHEPPKAVMKRNAMKRIFNAPNDSESKYVVTAIFSP